MRPLVAELMHVYIHGEGNKHFSRVCEHNLQLFCPQSVFVCDALFLQ